MRFFGIGGHVYINIDLIKEIWTDEQKVFLVDGTEYDMSQPLFDELLEIIKPTILHTSESEF